MVCQKNRKRRISKIHLSCMSIWKSRIRGPPKETCWRGLGSQNRYSSLDVCLRLNILRTLISSLGSSDSCISHTSVDTSLQLLISWASSQFLFLLFDSRSQWSVKQYPPMSPRRKETRGYRKVTTKGMGGGGGSEKAPSLQLGDVNCTLTRLRPPRLSLLHRR